MRFGSVCSGIEAASVAFAPLGWDAAWLAEVDVAASQVLAHRLGATAPKTPLPGSEKAIGRLSWGDRITNYGDMTTLPALVRSGATEAPDILCGGTPCQAFSVAGRREGLADARGQLTLSFVDLADAIDEVRAARGEDPAIIIWENVPGVLSDKSNAFGCFLAALAGEVLPLVPSGPRWTDAGVVLGPERAVAWRIGNAEYHGLAQRRRRVFVVASAREGFDPAAILLEFDGVRRDSPPSREAGEAVAGTLDARTDGGGFPGSDGAAAWHVVPGNRPADGRLSGDLTEPTWWDGSPVSQTLDAVLHKGQTMPEKNRFPAVLQPVACDAQSVALRGRDGGATAELGGEAAYALRASEGGGSDPYVLAPIPILEAGARTGASTTDLRAGMGVGQPGDPMYTLQGGKQHAIAFSCKDYGGDATEDVAPTMRAMGHSGSHANAGGQLAGVVHGTQDPNVNVELAHPLGRNNGGETAVCVTEPVTHTLKAEGFDASEDGTGRGQPIVAFAQRGRGEDVAFETSEEISNALRPSPGSAYSSGVVAQMAVRRLMPVECHRLQGFPDNWCAVPIGPKGKIAADGPQYKQLGNSWAVNHAYWVGARIAMWLAANEKPVAPALEADTVMLWLLAA